MYQDKEGGNFYLWMAIGQDDVDCWLSPGPYNTLQFHSELPCKEKEAHLIICSTTNEHNSTQLVHTALEYYNTAIKHDADATKETMPDPDMVDMLGYCTWNAFGKSVTIENIYQAMKSLQSHHIPISYLMIDDGWQQVTNNKMSSMDTCFPDGLKNTVTKLKFDFPFLKQIGVWHVSLH
jgi:alpha-galactosidase